MVYVLKRLYNYSKALEEISDPRIKSWFLMDSIKSLLIILAIYLLFVLKVGPNFMKNRQPYKLKWVMVVYNFVQVAICFYLVKEALFKIYLSGRYSLICEPVDYSNDPFAIFVADKVHLYFLVKVMDLLDTVFFVLRKKDNQVTFLHVYHHAGMVAISWHAVKYLAGGHGVLLGTINTFVHTIMYSYYLLTALRPSAKQNLWWKKYITQMQIAQFFVIMVHYTILIGTSCGFPKFTSFIMIPQNFFMFALFCDFYRRTYFVKKAVNASDAKRVTPQLSE